MSGFEQNVQEKLKGILPDIVIRAPHGKTLNYTTIIDTLKTQFPKQIYAGTPYSYNTVMLQTNDQYFHVASLCGIDPASEKETTELHTYLQKDASLKQLDTTNNIFVGSPLAQRFHLCRNQKIDLFYAEDQTVKRNKISFDRAPATVAGSFTTGMEDVDEHVIFCSLTFFTSLFPDEGVTRIGIKAMPHIDTKKLAAAINERTTLHAQTWMALYPAMISALALEKYAMIAILVLITLVAATNLIALISLFVTQKKRDIAILLAHGLPARHIRLIFIIISIGITLVAGAIGTSLGAIVGWYIDAFRIIALPHVYYVSHLPATIYPIHIVSIMGFVIALGLITALLATRSIARITIAKTLKYEV
jgi:lipoprotein-releasing system permease protein